MNPPPPPRSFAHQAASVSLAAPLVAVLANAAWRSIHQGEAFTQGGSLLVGGLATLLILAGFGFAIVALCGIPKHGKTGLLGRGIAGIIINGVLIVFFVAGMITGIKRAQNSRQTGAALDSANAELITKLRAQ